MEETDPRFKDKNPNEMVIPVSPLFQADLPQYNENSRNDPETEKFLGNTIWPGPNLDETPNDEAGKGRPDACTCRVPGNLRCIRVHVAQEKSKLINELGPAFREWKFDEMGDDALLNWSSQEIAIIKDIILMVPNWSAKEFLESALDALKPGKNRESIVSYLYNVVIPRRIGAKTRSGNSASGIHTDDESVSNGKQRAESGQKRRRLFY